MKLAIGCDHRGLNLKNSIIMHLRDKGWDLEDFGTYSPESTDYPIYGEKVARAVVEGRAQMGILVCGTGFGISLSANAVEGARCVNCSDVYTATLTRRHNNGNILALGADVISIGLANMIVDAFLGEEFEGGRHTRRLNMVADIRRRSRLITGKTLPVHIGGRELTLYNQRCPEWTYPYEYAPNPGGTLTHSGCGVFSLCEAIEYMSGVRVSPEEMADFSVSVGGRAEDGTDRPTLLKAIVEHGLDSEYGFRYALDGHLNDRSLLWDCISGGGCALANLRAGHIVALVGSRISPEGEKQLLVIDCHSESADDRIREQVREILPESEVRYAVTNSAGVITGYSVSSGVFWVPLSLPRDFDLLHAL